MRRSWVAFAGAALISILSATVHADDFFEQIRQAAEAGDPVSIVAVGDRAYMTSDFADAARWYEESIRLGQTARLSRLAEMYEKAQGVTRNPPRAAELYQRAIAAMTGPAGTDSWVALEIGTLYRDGKGYAPDPAKAAEWFRRSAAMGNTNALVELAALELKAGRNDEAVRHLRDAAKAGSLDALSRLGSLYYVGKSVPQDYAAALAFMELAAKGNYPWDLVQIGDMYAKGEGTDADPAKATEWWKRAQVELPKLADANPFLYFTLGNMSLDGKGTDKDEAQALRLFDAGAARGDLSSRTLLANSNKTDALSQSLALKWTKVMVDAGDAWMVERYGDLLDKQGKSDEALPYWKKALTFYSGIAKDDARAAARLGNMYRRGKGVTADVDAAIKWLTLATTKATDPDSEAALGEIFFGLGPDPEKYALALNCYKQSADHGNAWVLEQIGDMYANGLGTTVDPDEANLYYAKAAAFYAGANTPWTTFLLGSLYANGRGVSRDIIKARQLLTLAQQQGVGQAQSALQALDQEILRTAAQAQ